MFRVITIAREYGSGGASIAAALAARTGWRLLDKIFLSEVAQRVDIEPALARKYDECLDSWVHRVAKRGLWHGTLARLPAVNDRDFFDADTMAALSAELIQQAAQAGNAIIVGRGGQCLLQSRPDTFHAFVYAPMRQRLERLRARLDCKDDLEELAKSVDEMRTQYIKAHFGCDWKNPHLYDLMINSGLGEGRVVDAILAASTVKVDSKE